MRNVFCDDEDVGALVARGVDIVGVLVSLWLTAFAYRSLCIGRMRSPGTNILSPLRMPDLDILSPAIRTDVEFHIVRQSAGAVTC